MCRYPSIYVMYRLTSYQGMYLCVHVFMRVYAPMCVCVFVSIYVCKVCYVCTDLRMYRYILYIDISYIDILISIYISICIWGTQHACRVICVLAQ